MCSGRDMTQGESQAAAVVVEEKRFSNSTPLALHAPDVDLSAHSMSSRLDPERSNKRARVAQRPAGGLASSDSLPWKKVKRPAQASFGALDHEGGMLELEEVEGVEVIYEDVPGGGRRVTFKVQTTAWPPINLNCG